MSQHVAFYEVLTDPNIELKQPLGDLDTELTFTPPTNAATDNPAILSFMVGFINAKDLKFRINLNGNSAVKLNPENGTRVSSFCQEIVGAIKPGLSNKLKCFIESGTGTVGFSDMVIWYQRNV
jgi:hypothetical protein